MAHLFSQQRLANTLGKIAAAVGVLLLAGGAYIGEENVVFQRRAARVQGEVVDVVRVDGATGARRSGRGSAWYPVIAYKPEGGPLVTKRASVGSAPPSYSEGEKLDILYDPSEPEHFQIDDPVAMWMGTFVLSFIGLLFVSIGLLLVWIGRREFGAKRTTPQ